MKHLPSEKSLNSPSLLELVSQIIGVSSFFLITVNFLILVIENYEYGVVDRQQAMQRNQNTKDIIKLNKQVLKEGATNSAVSIALDLFNID